MRVNRAIEDGSLLRERGALAFGAFERGGDVHLLGLVSYGGVHSHIDHLRALLALRARRRRGSTRSPTGATSRRTRRYDDLAELPAGPDRHRRRPLLRDGPRPALGADAARARRDRRTASGVHATTLSHAVQQSYDAGVTDEFVEPVVVDGPAAARARRRRRDLLQLPARPRAPALAALCSSAAST